jgi:transposase
VEVPSRFEISDELWAEVEPLIPARPRRRRYAGRNAIDDRLVLNGILHVLHTGIAWEDLPREYGYGSGVTCWRRLRTWQQAGAGRRCCTPARSAGKAGRPRQKPDLVLADRGYDHDKHRRLLWARGIKPVIARRGAEHGSNLGRQRWVVERGFAHLHNFRRLRTRYERDPEIHEAFLSLACAILCFRSLQSF